MRALLFKLFIQLEIKVQNIQKEYFIFEIKKHRNLISNLKYFFFISSLGQQIYYII